MVAAIDPLPGPPRTTDWNRVLQVALPLALLASTLWLWESYVQRNAVPRYVLPAPRA